MGFMDVPRHLNNKASSLYSLCRNLGGSFGIALIATYLYRHTQIWQTHLGSNLTSASVEAQQALSRVSEALVAAGADPASIPAQAHAMLYRQLQHQAGLMAYIDSFHAMALMMFLVAPLALLMPGVMPKGKPQMAE
jgi:DHA2 family multidrug resistance protein